MIFLQFLDFADSNHIGLIYHKLWLNYLYAVYANILVIFFRKIYIYC